MKYSLVMVTAPEGEEAQILARYLLENKLCACVNVFRGVESYFWWEGRIDRAQERLLIIKTKKNLVQELIRQIRARHSYSVCEVIEIPILSGNKSYLDWIEESCTKKERKKR